MQISALRAAADFDAQVQRAAEHLATERVYERILARDHTVWRPDPTEIANRLGWLDSPRVMRDAIGPIRQFIDAVRADGYTHALLLGMGGSSLAPEVFRETFGVADGFLDLSVLDSTQPDAVLAKERTLDPARTLFLPATKSGGTVETLSLLKYFYNRTADALGPAEAGRHFAAITDPGSGLEALAQRLGFRHIFRNDPNIGGRYSALSYYGLVAAGAIGADLNRLLDRANRATADPQPGIQLGAFLGAGALAGRDKLTLITSPAVSAAGAWIEQLIAESTGKDGKGLLPIDLEPECAVHTYGPDRLFVHLRLDDAADARAQAIAAAGHPLLCLQLADAYDLGAAFFHWEIATAIAGFFLNIHPFDQPDVEAAKELARQMVAAYQQRGALPSPAPDLVDGLSLYGPVQGTTLAQTLEHFLASGERGSYIALQAHLSPTPEITNALQDLRHQLLAHTGLATTLGFGPRFLHSTGQLHKGDAGRGLFIQLTADSAEDAPIPNEAGASASSITFGVLAQAQALGDRQALLDQGRAVLRIHLGADITAGIAQLRHALDPNNDPTGEVQ